MLHLLQDSPPENIVKHSPLHLHGEIPAQNGAPVTPTAPATAGVPGAPAVSRGTPALSPVSPVVHRPLESLTVRGLTYTYPGSDVGIRDVTFTMRRGEFVVVTGRIGSGKTTLLRALQGLVPAGGGEILWNGERVDDPAAFFRPPHSAYTSQTPRLFSETLRENILLGETNEEGLETALELAVLAPDVDALERALDTLVGNRGVKLSGGQVQRAAAARSFMRAADLLIFDDISSALDVQTENTLWESLFTRRDVTCLVVSHRHVALKRATRLIILDEGRIVAEGSPDEVMAGETWRELWERDGLRQWHQPNGKGESTHL